MCDLIRDSITSTTVFAQLHLINFLFSFRRVSYLNVNDGAEAIQQADAGANHNVNDDNDAARRALANHPALAERGQLAPAPRGRD